MKQIKRNLFSEERRGKRKKKKDKIIQIRTWRREEEKDRCRQRRWLAGQVKRLKKGKKKNETVCCQQGERYIMTPQADTISRMPMTYIYKIAAVNVAPTSLFLYSIGRLLQNFFFPFDKSSTSQTRFTDSFKINKIINWRLTVDQVKEKKKPWEMLECYFFVVFFWPGYWQGAD